MARLLYRNIQDKFGGAFGEKETRLARGSIESGNILPDDLRCPLTDVVNRRGSWYYLKNVSARVRFLSGGLTKELQNRVTSGSNK